MALKEDLTAYLKTFRKLNFFSKVFTGGMLLIAFLNIADLKSKVIQFKGFLADGLAVYQQAKHYLLLLLEDILTIEINEIGLDIVILASVYMLSSRHVQKALNFPTFFQLIARTKDKRKRVARYFMASLFISACFYGVAFLLLSPELQTSVVGVSSEAFIIYLVFSLIVFGYLGPLIMGTYAARQFNIIFIKTLRYRFLVPTYGTRKLKKTYEYTSLFMLGMVLLVSVVAAISSGLAA